MLLHATLHRLRYLLKSLANALLIRAKAIAAKTCVLIAIVLGYASDRRELIVMINPTIKQTSLLSGRAFYNQGLAVRHATLRSYPKPLPGPG
jgi:hypothetical protein